MLLHRRTLRLLLLGVFSLASFRCRLLRQVGGTPLLLLRGLVRRRPLRLVAIVVAVAIAASTRSTVLRSSRSGSNRKSTDHGLLFFSFRGGGSRIRRSSGSFGVRRACVVRARKASKAPVPARRRRCWRSRCAVKIPKGGLRFELVAPAGNRAQAQVLCLIRGARRCRGGSRHIFALSSTRGANHSSRPLVSVVTVDVVLRLCLSRSAGGGCGSGGLCLGDPGGVGAVVADERGGVFARSRDGFVREEAEDDDEEDGAEEEQADVLL